MRSKTLLISTMFMAVVEIQAQVCDPSVAPSGLTSTYTSGIGAVLQWDAVPGSIGVQVKATSPSGGSVNRRIVGTERDQLLVPDALLEPGTYTWRVQAACSTIPPYSVTPISSSASFTVATPSTCPSTVTDIDGNVYPVVEIGSQCWMAENLKTENYSNGDSIPTNLGAFVWSGATFGACDPFNFSVPNKNTYGMLYNWYAAVDPRGLCPTGWHVPSDTEWTELTDELGGEAVAGGSLKATGTTLAGTGLWNNPNNAATNSSGFTGLPAGFRDVAGNFPGISLGVYGIFWSTTERFPGEPWYRLLANFDGVAYRISDFSQNGYSVRCLKD